MFRRCLRLIDANTWGALLVLAASCGGRAVGSDPLEPASGGATAGGSAGAAMTAGSSSGGGNRGGMAGAGASGGAASGGAAPTTCRFEPIGEGLRCENAESRAQDAFSGELPGAVTLEQCEAACLMDETCTAVTDYFEHEPLDLCLLRTTPCNAPGTGTWQEEDAGKEYVKRCKLGACMLVYLGNWIRCEEADSSPFPGAVSFEQCRQACLADDICVSVVDYFWLREVHGCFLYTSTCEKPVPLPYGDPGRTYRKVCD